MFAFKCAYLSSGPLEDGLEEEEEECVSEENEMLAKDEFSAEENFTAEFESGNMSCEDMDYFCNKGEGSSPRLHESTRAGIHNHFQNLFDSRFFFFVPLNSIQF